MIPLDVKELGKRVERLTDEIDRLQDFIVMLNKPVEYRFESGSSRVHYKIKGNAQAQKRFGAFAEQELAYLTGELIGLLGQMQELIDPAPPPLVKSVNFAERRKVVTQKQVDDLTNACDRLQAVDDDLLNRPIPRLGALETDEYFGAINDAADAGPGFSVPADPYFTIGE